MRTLKLSAIALFILFLTACSVNGVDKDIHKDGELIINKVYTSFNEKEYISDEDGEFIYEFFQNNNFPEDENFKNENEEFIYNVALLEMINVNYLEAIKNLDLNKIKEQEEKFNMVLQDTIEKFNIEIEEQS